MVKKSVFLGKWIEDGLDKASVYLCRSLAQCDKIFCHMTLYFTTFWQSLLLYTNTSKPKRHFDKISRALFYFFFYFFYHTYTDFVTYPFCHYLDTFVPYFSLFSNCSLKAWMSKSTLSFSSNFSSWYMSSLFRNLCLYSFRSASWILNSW